MRLTTEHFEILSGSNIYKVKATRYLNGIEEKRYRVCFDESPVCMFGWDPETNSYKLMFDLRNPQLPEGLETAIGNRLTDIEPVKRAA